MHPALLIIIYAVSTGIVWLGVHITEFVYARVPHEWNNRPIIGRVTIAAICCFVGYVLWLILALVDTERNLLWWHPIMGVLISLFVGTIGGIATGKYAVYIRRTS